MYKYLPLFLLFISTVSHAEEFSIPIMDVQKNINSQILNNKYIRHIAITADNNDILLKVDINNHNLIEYASYRAQIKYNNKNHFLLLDQIEKTNKEKLINPVEVNNELNSLELFDMGSKIDNHKIIKITFKNDVIYIND